MVSLQYPHPRLNPLHPLLFAPFLFTVQSAYRDSAPLICIFKNEYFYRVNNNVEITYFLKSITG